MTMNKTDDDDPENMRLNFSLRGVREVGVWNGDPTIVNHVAEVLSNENGAAPEVGEKFGWVHRHGYWLRVEVADIYKYATKLHEPDFAARFPDLEMPDLI